MLAMYVLLLACLPFIGPALAITDVTIHSTQYNDLKKTITDSAGGGGSSTNLTKIENILLGISEKLDASVQLQQNTVSQLSSLHNALDNVYNKVQTNHDDLIKFLLNSFGEIKKDVWNQTSLQLISLSGIKTSLIQIDQDLDQVILYQREDSETTSSIDTNVGIISKNFAPGFSNVIADVLEKSTLDVGQLECNTLASNSCKFPFGDENFSCEGVVELSCKLAKLQLKQALARRAHERALSDEL